LINLLELGVSSFHDVFSWNRRFNCFKDREPHKRKKAIETINEAIETINEGTVKQPLIELQEFFGAHQHPISSSEENQLATTFEDMRLTETP